VLLLDGYSVMLWQADDALLNLLKHHMAQHCTFKVLRLDTPCIL